jgi:hypothetical protein
MWDIPYASARHRCADLYALTSNNRHYSGCGGAGKIDDGVSEGESKHLPQYSPVNLVFVNLAALDSHAILAGL